MENDEKMVCPICGKDYNSLDAVISESGNPICPQCAENEE